MGQRYRNSYNKEIKEKERKENKCLGDSKENYKSKFDENDKNNLGLKNRIQRGDRNIELDSGYIKMKLKMISYMYTIKMKLKNSIAQKENYKASLSKRMNIKKRDY